MSLMVPNLALDQTAWATSEERVTLNLVACQPSRQHRMPEGIKVHKRAAYMLAANTSVQPRSTGFWSSDWA